MVMAVLVPATPIVMARLCHMIGVAGTSPAMTNVDSGAIETCADVSTSLAL